MKLYNWISIVRIKSFDLKKKKKCSRVLRLSVLHLCRKGPQTALCCFCLSLRHGGVLRIGRLVVYLFRQCITFCKKCKLGSNWHWLRFRWNDQWSWLIDGSLESRYVLNCANGMTCFESCAYAFKSSGWSLVWNGLLTKKLKKRFSLVEEVGPILSSM